MHELIQKNQRQTAILIVVMAVLLLALGYALAELIAPQSGMLGLLLAFILWIILSLVSYFKGDSILLAISGAREIEKKDHPVLFNIVEEMCVASGSSTVPRIYIIDDAAPNAFATGRDRQHAVVAVTSGLLERLTRDELQGVIAHELGHVNNRDILYMMMVGVMMGAIVLLAHVGSRVLRYGGRTRTGSSRRGGGQAQMIIFVVAIVLIILAPVIARLLYMAVSRRREYLADASGALYTRYPEGLASALEKLAQSKQRLQTANAAMAPMYIVNPLAVAERSLDQLTSTHPPIGERIRILRGMGGMGGLQTYDESFRKVTGRPVGVIPFTALESTPAPQNRPAPIVDAMTHLDRVRETTNVLWQLQDFVFIACACGTKLKIPPAYAGRKIECPHCATVHSVQGKAGP